MMNFYEVLATNDIGVNVALSCSTSFLSFNAANNAGYRGVDGIASESSYYNSGGTSSSEFWQVDLASGNCALASGTPVQVSSETWQRMSDCKL